MYAAVTGPSFETPAEIRFLRIIGADLVGMSTVPEMIAARHVGMEVLAISCVTNMAAGMTGEKITAEEVLETGERVRGKFLALLRAVLPRMERSLAESRFTTQVRIRGKLGEKAGSASSAADASASERPRDDRMKGLLWQQLKLRLSKPPCRVFQQTANRLGKTRIKGILRRS